MKSSCLIECAAAVAALAAAHALCAATIDVPAGRTVAPPAGTVYEGDALVKTGAGTLDLSNAALKNAGLEIREGAVRFSADAKPVQAEARHLCFSVHAARPNAQYSNSGWQISEFNVTKGGEVVPNPPGTRGTWRGDPGGDEGPAKAVDGNVKTKYYTNDIRGVLDIDFGRPVAFDGYTFTTANDAIGRDPRDFALDSGGNGARPAGWTRISSIAGFDCTGSRHANAGRIFPLMSKDKIPAGYPVKICGKGRLVLSELTEALEAVSGEGLVEVDGGSLAISSGASFSGSVSGPGSVSWH